MPTVVVCSVHNEQEMLLWKMVPGPTGETDVRYCPLCIAPILLDQRLEIDNDREALRRERDELLAKGAEARRDADLAVVERDRELRRADAIREELDTIQADLRRFCRLVGEFDGARPESPAAVFDKCLLNVEAMLAVVRHADAYCQCVAEFGEDSLRSCSERLDLLDQTLHDPRIQRALGKGE